MRRRLYFVLPDVDSAKNIENELLLTKIEDSHIHFLAKDGLALGSLHVANLFQKTDLIHGMEIGLVAGGITGILAGTAMYLSPGISSTVGMGGILVLSLLGAVVGTWASGMIAISIPNSRLKSFQTAIDGGKILLMVDVPVGQVKTIREMIVSHHPEAESKGQETQIPAFP